MSDTTESGPRQRNDTTMMYVVHTAFRRDMDELVALAERGDVPEEEIRACWERFKRFLHIHHTAEDTHLWPVLRGKLGGRGAELAVMEQMEDEHITLTSLLDATDAAVVASAPPHELLVLASRLGTALNEHCLHEEDLALPLVAELLSADEWNAFGAEQRRQVGLRGGATFFPWVLDGAPEHIRRKVLGYVPPPARVLYRWVWQPRYARGPRWGRRP